MHFLEKLSLEPSLDVLSQTLSKWQHTLEYRKYKESASVFNISQVFFKAYSQLTFT